MKNIHRLEIAIQSYIRDNVSNYDWDLIKPLELGVLINFTIKNLNNDIQELVEYSKEKHLSEENT